MSLSKLLNLLLPYELWTWSVNVRIVATRSWDGSKGQSLSRDKGKLLLLRQDWETGSWTGSAGLWRSCRSSGLRFRVSAISRLTPTIHWMTSVTWSTIRERWISSAASQWPDCNSERQTGECSGKCIETGADTKVRWDSYLETGHPCVSWQEDSADLISSHPPEGGAFFPHHYTPDPAGQRSHKRRSDLQPDLKPVLRLETGSKAEPERTVIVTVIATVPGKETLSYYYSQCYSYSYSYCYNYSYS